MNHTCDAYLNFSQCSIAWYKILLFIVYIMYLLIDKGDCFN